MHHFATPIADRRAFLQRTGSAFGLTALSALLSDQHLLAETPSLATHNSPLATPLNPLAPKRSHFRAKAKSVIWLFMNGGQSHVDTWDYKPALEKADGQELKGFDKNTGFFANSVGPLMKSPFKFARHGKSGTWASEIFPGLSRHVDDMAFIHSCFTQTNNHSPALFEANTGMSRMGFPCVGSWVTYGLGTLNQNLPAFVVMYDTLGRGLPKGHASNWGPGFLPGVFQGTALNNQGQPINNMTRPPGVTDAQQRGQLDLLNRLNKHHLAENPAESELAARIESFELAYRMQMAAPEALDLSQESEATKKLYGLENKTCEVFARQCLTARRLVERGVRFVQIFAGKNASNDGAVNDVPWDGHNNIETNHRACAAATDQPAAALLQDLRARGLLEDTLVVWGGEFGRTSDSQGSVGRDHNPNGFTIWLAGGGVKGGFHYGSTDEFGYKAVENKIHVNDLHATLLHLLGLNHEKLTFRHNGRDDRLTEVFGHVVKEIVA
jgi:hypothetical protein